MHQNTAQVEMPVLTIHLSFYRTILLYRSNRNSHKCDEAVDVKTDFDYGFNFALGTH